MRRPHGVGARLLLIMAVGSILLTSLFSIVTALALLRARDQVLATAAEGLENQGKSYLKLLVDQNTSLANKELATATAAGMLAAQAVLIADRHKPIDPTYLSIAQLTRLPNGDLIDTRTTRITNISAPAGASREAIVADLERAGVLDTIVQSQFQTAHNIVGISYVGASGLVQTYPPANPQSGRTTHDRSLLALFADHRGSAVWLPPHQGTPAIGVMSTVVVPVYAEHERLLGVIAIDVSLGFVTYNLKSLRPTAGSAAFLIDNRRTLIAATNEALPYLAPLTRPHPSQDLTIQTLTITTTSNAELDAAIEHMLYTPEKTPRLNSDVDHVQIDRHPFFLAYAPILETGWTLGLLTPIDELTMRATNVSGVIMDTSQAVLLAMLFSAIAFTGLSALAGMYLTRRLTQPLVQLAAAAGAIGRGDYRQEVPVRSDDEFGRVARAFNTMSRSLMQASEALRESEERYRLIAENSNDMIGIFDRTGCFVYASPSHRYGLGRDPAALIGTSITDLVHPDDQPTLQEQWRASLALQRGSQFTVRCHHADGSWRWWEANATIIERQGERYILAVARDITERRRLEEQLMQAQKMESVGRLAGGIAHDFNNLLTAITGYVNLALDALPSEDPIRGDLVEVQKAADRAAALTRQLLAFARKQIIQPRALNLNDLILDMDKMFRRLIGEDIDLVTLPASDLGPVKADPGQIEQLLINLVVNARDAMSEGGQLTVETANVVLEQDSAGQHVGVAAGAYVMLAVSDTGIGMDEVIKSRIFEPFFTTKETGRGTGLGLATCYGIVKQHGGHIWVYSEPNRGTTFKVYLPQVQAVADQRPQLDDSLPPQGNETVLLVEDEDAVRTMAARVLREQGYMILMAANGDEALRLVEALPDQTVDLLLSDVVMPRMNGKSLAERLMARYPAVKVLFISGYTESGIVRNGQLDAGTAFLQKPFSPATLVRKVREVLDA